MCIRDRGSCTGPWTPALPRCTCGIGEGIVTKHVWTSFQIIESENWRLTSTDNSFTRVSPWYHSLQLNWSVVKYRKCHDDVYFYLLTFREMEYHRSFLGWYHQSRVTTSCQGHSADGWLTPAGLSGRLVAGTGVRRAGRIGSTGGKDTDVDLSLIHI